MYRTATLNTRINPDLKDKAENILHKIGLTSAEAIRIFYAQICLRKGLPFDHQVREASRGLAPKPAGYLIKATPDGEPAVVDSPVGAEHL